MKAHRLPWLGLLVMCAPSAPAGEPAVSTEALIEAKQRVVQHMALNPVVLRAVRRQNAEALSPDVRKARESEWGNDATDTPLKRALEGTAAGHFLKAQVDRDPVLVQATLTDSAGDTVAAFPAQGSYFHGDDETWLEAYNDGAGKVVTHTPTGDDGGGATVKIAAPVLEQGKTIGVLVVAATVGPADTGR